MTALELIARLRDKGIRIAARDGELELDAPRGAIDAELRADLVRRKPELLRLLSWSRRSARDLPLVPASREQPLPLSWAQQRLWFLDQLEPNSSAYNISWTVRLKGELNTGALQAALDQLVARHETLRTNFPDENGEPWQHVADRLAIPIDCEDLTGVSNEQLRVRLGKLAAGPFDLAVGPLVRVTLLRLADEEYILLVVIHHIVADGASMRVLFRELAALYEMELTGGQAELPPLAVQYADFAVWQRQWLDSEELQRQTDYWLEQLQGLPPLLELPADRPRSAAMRYRGASVLRVLPASLAEELRTLGRGQGSTLFMVMLAAFYVLLMRYSGRHDLVVGTPMGGRPRTGLESLIGFFINTVVLRADLGGDPSFSELLQQVRDVALGAHANQELPFEKLVEVLQPQRELSYSPVFQVMFDLQEEPRWRLPVKNLEVVPEVVFSSRTSSFDLTLSVRQAENGLDAMFEYDTDLFDEVSIERLASHYQALLQEVVANPARPISQFALTSAEEQQRIVATWGSVAADFPAALTLQALFEAQVATRPGAIGLQAGQDVHSYAELNRRANRLAHRLQAMGVEIDTPVALSASRTPESFIAMLGILKSGGCVLPLDPEYPRQRLEFMLTDAGATRVLVTPENESAFAGIAGGVDVLLLDSSVLDSPDYPDANPTSLAGSESLAFIMYTSGSTGKPKGVGLPHCGLVNYVHQLGRKTALSPDDRVLQFASPSFDICIEETFAAWFNGATLVLRDADMNLSADEFFAGCDRHVISWMSLPTAWWHELCARLEGGEHALPASLRSVVIGGEKARLDAFAVWQEVAAGVRLLNTYGPTETSIAATWCELTHLDPATCGELPIGHPVPNVFAWVLDEHLRPLPVGVPGELYIGGVGVATGYWQQPELSAGQFIADPFSDHPAARLYRTGDRARYLADGRLVFLGRVDGQVKIRGHRIEPGEIEAVIAGTDGVGSCAVSLHEAAALTGAPDARLVAYVVGKVPTGKLRQRLRDLLPEYMLPSAIVRLEKLPLTHNGKLDYRALPEPEFARDETQTYFAPRNAVESRLAKIWAEVLGVPKVGVHDDFFALGGHSLLATRVVSRVRDAMASAVPLRELFEAPTVAGFALALERNSSSDESVPLLRRDPATRLLPLSWAQQRLWVLDQLEPQSAAYNLPWVARLSGSVDEAALQQAVDTLVARHESLRTAFGGREGEPVQLIASGLQVPVQIEDWPGATEQSVQARLLELIVAPFDLHKPPLLRVHLLRIADDRSVLLLVLHHIVADGWSMGVLFRELAHCYNQLHAQQPALLPDLPVQYADFAIWQRDWLSGAELARQESYWTRQLADAPPVLELPLDYPRPPAQSYRGAWVGAAVDAALLDGLRTLAAREGATLFMVLLAAFKALLAVQTGAQDLVVGTPIAGRRRTELEGLIGCFLNTLAVRTQLRGNPTFTELLERVRQTTLGAYDHQELPFEKLLEVLQPARSTAYTPIVQVMFNLQNAPMSRLELDGLQVESFDLDRGTAKFDLSAVLVEGQDGLKVGFEYNTDLFARESVAEMLDQYTLLLEKVVADPQMDLGTLVRTRLPEVPGVPGSPLPDAVPAWDLSGGTIIERFTAIVARYPERIAVQDDSACLNYRELEAWSNSVAQLLAAACQGERGNIGLLLGHDARMVAGLLGTLAAGCAYVPLDQRAPAARLQSIIADAGIRVVLSDGANDALLQAVCAENGDLTLLEVPAQPDLAVCGPPVVTAAPDDLAYVLFTSGSTGTPKGVMQTQQNVLHHARAYSQALNITAGDRLTLLSTYGFDAAVMDIYGALLNGACLHPFDILASAGPRALLECISENGLTVLHATPTVFRYLLSEGSSHCDLSDVRAVVLGGEEAAVSDFDLFKTVFPEPAIFINGLGPSESTTALQFCANHQTRLPGNIVPVGFPVGDTEVLLLDESGQVSGISGELVIRSDFVSSGYWGQPELSAERFVSDVAGYSGRLYRSGDRARYLPDGQLVFCGRLDEQLKVRGQRIEPAEIELAIRSVPGVERCAVVLRPGPATTDADTKVLVAYVQGEVDAAELRGVLQLRLPDYMLPAAFVPVSTLPLLANGKLDRHALPQPDWARSSAADAAPPASETEQQLHAIWSDVMGRRAIGIHDDFFELGGHSLMATRVVARVRDALGIELPLRELFANPTIAQLAIVLAAAAGADIKVPVLRAHTAGELPPLSWAQQRLWFLDQLEPDSAAYNLHWAARLDGAIGMAAMRAAINALVARHDSLRTTFSGSDTDAGNPVQVIAPYIEVEVQEEVFSGATEERLHSRLLELIHRPFDLQHGPLFRAHLLRVSENQVVLLLTMHHIVSDGWSMGVLVRELATLYNLHVAADRPAGSENPVTPEGLPELPVQYADYAVWQRAWLSGGELERQEAYWKTQLANVPPLLDLPLDHIRPPVQRFRGAWVSETLSPELGDELRDFASAAGATLFMVLLSAFKVLVARHTGREDVVIGTPIAGRRRTELEGLIGFFLNTLVLRSDLTGNPSFSEVVARVKQTTLGAYDHQELPFEKLLEILQPTRSTAYTPVVQIMFNLHNEPGGAMDLDGVAVSPFSVDRGTAKFDLSVAVVEGAGGLQIGFEYNTDLFERDTVARLLRHYGEILTAIAHDPHVRVAEMSLSAPPQAQLPQLHHDALTWREDNAQTLTDRFAEIVARYANRPAVATALESLTYSELDGWSDGVAHRLIERVAPGSRVGLLLGHDAKMVAGLLGVLKAGCVYVPLDREAPAARVKSIIDDADMAAVLTAAEYRGVLDDKPGMAPLVVEMPDVAVSATTSPGNNLQRKIKADDLAYILFTSGSTGKPKGVMQNHRNILHHVRTYTNALHIGAEDRLSLFSTYGFDASIMDIFGALLNGACLCPLDIRSHEHPGQLLDLMGRSEGAEKADPQPGISILHATPTVFRFLMRHKVCRHDLSAVRLVVLGGEEARSNDFTLFKRHFAPPALLVNGLGPSESTLATQFFADHQTHLPGQIVPVGNAVADTSIVLLNEDGSEAGISGEMGIRSSHVSLGYWQQAELTNERFLADPTEDEPGRYLYRTGDRVRMLPDGQLVYLGRIDGQVKVRGHRIEPGEIEAQLAAIPGVDRCAVVLRSDGIDGRDADVRLVAYVVLDEEGVANLIDANALRRNLRSVLPDYMVPQSIMLLEELPLLANGKADRSALPAPDWARDETQIYVQPRTETERQLAGIWSDVLGVPNVGIHDDFFELGGHSLMAAQLVARVTESLQVGLPLRRLFDTPTIAGIAEHVDALQWALHNQPELPAS